MALVLMLAAALDRQGLARLPLYVGTGWLALASIAALGSVQARAFRAPAPSWSRARPRCLRCHWRRCVSCWCRGCPARCGPCPAATAPQTGLSDEMSPGSISELSVSEEIAFRVRFDGPPPPTAQRYWRGPVLHDFDGYTWRRRHQPGHARSTPDEMLSPPLRYQRDAGTARAQLPVRAGHAGAASTASATSGCSMAKYMAARPISAPVAYQAVSHLQSRSTGELVDTRPAASIPRLPQGRNARSIALAQELRATVGIGCRVRARA